MKIGVEELIVKLKKPKVIFLAANLFIALFIVKHRFDSRLAVSEVAVGWKKKHTSYVDSTGQIRAGQEAFMTLRKGGRLDEIKIPQGSAVKKGDIILLVDAANNRAGLERALSKYRFAAAEFSRNKHLLAAAAATRQAYEETQNQLTVTRSELEEARQKLEDSIIRSPVDGVVTLIAFRVGDFVPDGSRVAVVEDQSNYEITARIPMSRQEDLPAQSKVTIASTKVGKLKVKSREVEAQIESMAAFASAVSQDFDAKLRFDKLPKGFAVKEQVQVRIPMQTFKNVAELQLHTVFDIQATPRVLMLGDDDLPKWHEVEVVDVVQDKVYVHGLDRHAKVVIPASGFQATQVVGQKVVINPLQPAKA